MRLLASKNGANARGRRFRNPTAAGARGFSLRRRGRYPGLRVPGDSDGQTEVGQIRLCGCCPGKIRLFSASPSRLPGGFPACGCRRRKTGPFQTRSRWRSRTGFSPVSGLNDGAYLSRLPCHYTTFPAGIQAIRKKEDTDKNGKKRPDRGLIRTRREFGFRQSPSSSIFRVSEACSLSKRTPFDRSARMERVT